MRQKGTGAGTAPAGGEQELAAAPPPVTADPRHPSVRSDRALYFRTTVAVGGATVAGTATMCLLPEGVAAQPPPRAEAAVVLAGLMVTLGAPRPAPAAATALPPLRSPHRRRGRLHGWRTGETVEAVPLVAVGVQTTAAVLRRVVDRARGAGFAYRRGQLRIGASECARAAIDWGCGNWHVALSDGSKANAVATHWCQGPWRTLILVCWT